ncbi:MAG: hypothetical protein M1837_000244 [Sclerophora amabilis]|nr:MAG: hypothetical protein M1837_000244 [Sclerophora amabilis]
MENNMEPPKARGPIRGQSALALDRTPGRLLPNPTRTLSLRTGYINPDELSLHGLSEDEQDSQQNGNVRKRHVGQCDSNDDKEEEHSTGRQSNYTKAAKGRKRVRAEGSFPTVPTSDHPNSYPMIDNVLPQQTGANILQLVIHVPSGHAGGPYTINVHPEMLSKLSVDAIGGAIGGPQSPTSTKLGTRRTPAELTSNGTQMSSGCKTRFMDFPPEIRNMVYRYLFRDTDPVDFHKRDNLCRSANLLATCKQAHAEGRAVLYSENAFLFRRRHATRGEYFDKVWQEVGYKDVESFLLNIGPRNVGRIREISLSLEDALPSSSREQTPFERRFVNNQKLQHCLEILGRQGGLKKLTLSFLGRKTFGHEDGMFVDQLRTITKLESLSFGPSSKISVDARRELHETMVKDAPTPTWLRGSTSPRRVAWGQSDNSG